MLTFHKLYKFYLACGLKDLAAREAAKNYMKLQEKYYRERTSANFNG